MAEDAEVDEPAGSRAGLDPPVLVPDGGAGPKNRSGDPAVAASGKSNRELSSALPRPVWIWGECGRRRRFLPSRALARGPCRRAARPHARSCRVPLASPADCRSIGPIRQSGALAEAPTASLIRSLAPQRHDQRVDPMTVGIVAGLTRDGDESRRPAAGWRRALFAQGDPVCGSRVWSPGGRRRPDSVNQRLEQRR